MSVKLQYYAPWQQIEGPRIIEPTQYYNIPEGLSADSQEADIQRQRLLREQIVYRHAASDEGYPPSSLCDPSYRLHGERKPVRLSIIVGVQNYDQLRS